MRILWSTAKSFIEKKWLWIAGIVSFVVIGNALYNRPTGGYAPAPPTPATAKPVVAAQQLKRTFNVGDEVTLVNASGTSVLVGTSEDAYNRIQKAFAASDTHGYLELLQSGQAFGVKNGTRVKLIDRGYQKRQIRVLEGDMSGRSGWVPKEWLQ